MCMETMAVTGKRSALQTDMRETGGYQCVRYYDSLELLEVSESD